MSVSVRVHTGIMSTDTRWLNSGWSPSQAAQKQPRRNGPSESRLLHCRQMSVKEKQVVNKAKTYSREVLQRGQTKKERTKAAVAFVTKVQIKRRAPWTQNVRHRDETMEEAEEEPTCRKGCELELQNTPSLSQEDFKHNVTNIGPTNTLENDVPVEMFPSKIEDNVENIQGMIRCLSRRLGESSAELRRRQSAKPLASFARPTKGELSLSEKGPVVLAPVLTSQEMKLRGQIYDRDGGKDDTERKSLRKESNSARDDILVQGRRSIGHRLSRSAPEGVGLGLLDPRKPLCACCRGSLLNEDAGKAAKRSQSASTERARLHKETKRNSTGKLVRISRHMQRSVPSMPHTGHASRLISPCRGTGLLQNGPLTLDLSLRLGSRDYETPVPPSSPDQSDGEYCSNEQ